MKSLRPGALAMVAVTLMMSAPAVSAIGEERRREAGPHVHGHGTLDIAIENNRVSMELEVPGMDIVGFEHRARTKEQKTALGKAMTQLGNPLALFKLPPAADCKVARAEVEIARDDGDDRTQPDRTARTRPKGHEHDEGGGHNEFLATYILECANPAGITAIQFDYFKLFPRADELTVNLVTAKGQSSYKVGRKKPLLDLAGMM
jgi:hypothetical protein